MDSGLALGTIQESLAAVGINSKRRAETVTLLEFVDLTHAIRRYNPWVSIIPWLFTTTEKIINTWGNSKCSVSEVDK